MFRQILRQKYFKNIHLKMFSKQKCWEKYRNIQYRGMYRENHSEMFRMGKIEEPCSGTERFQNVQKQKHMLRNVHEQSH